MKKRLALFLILAMLFSVTTVLTACDDGEDYEPKSDRDDSDGTDDKKDNQEALPSDNDEDGSENEDVGKNEDDNGSVDATTSPENTQHFDYHGFHITVTPDYFPQSRNYFAGDTGTILVDYQPTDFMAALSGIDTKNPTVSKIAKAWLAQYGKSFTLRVRGDFLYTYDNYTVDGQWYTRMFAFTEHNGEFWIVQFEGTGEWDEVKGEWLDFLDSVYFV